MTLFLLAALAASVAPPASAPDPAAEVRLHQDWAWMARYGAANAGIVNDPARPRIVFLGDSITQGWFDLDPGFFVPGRIGRGIGGQTTPQMLVRFRQDVIDLHPDVVQIMAGTNDIASNTGPMTDEQTQGNIRSMVELAQAHGIRVILASIPPADQFPWRPGLETGAHIVRLNAWLKAYAARAGCVYADYWSGLKGDDLGAREGLTKDHVHPTPAGYAVMDKVAEAAIREALAMPRPTPLPVAGVR
jgi:lysophospholipase L1-like esterase